MSVAGLAALAATVPGAALAQAGEPVPTIGEITLPHNLTPLGMFLTADIVVKAVLVGLAIASVVTWTVCLAKIVELVVLKRRTRAALSRLLQIRSISDCAEFGNDGSTVVGKCIDALRTEIELSACSTSAGGIKERIGSRLERIEAGSARRIVRGTGVLATIGATAPFVGLFGTVWGIMNSFIGISQSHTTNLAVVAPGIAEALLATAMGLAAAIPAVVIYNMLARSIASYRLLMGDVSAAALRLASRDLVAGRVVPAEQHPQPAAE